MSSLTYEYMRELKRYKGKLSQQEYKTLKGQILSGNGSGAMRGLNKILERKQCVSMIS